MTQDDAVAILRKAGFDPRPVEQAGWSFAMPEEHRTTADDWWDPGHPLLARGEFIAMPTARLIALAQAVVYASHDPDQWAVFRREARFAKDVEHGRRN